MSTVFGMGSVSSIDDQRTGDVARSPGDTVDSGSPESGCGSNVERSAASFQHVETAGSPAMTETIT
jgi:hypothetical protein